MSEDPYAKLRFRLQKEKFPTLFMFKFIVRPDQVEEVKELFGPAEVYTNTSRHGNYVSVTGKEIMLDSERVIERYKEAAQIEGLIAL